MPTNTDLIHIIMPHCNDEGTRRALVQTALHGSPVLNHIDWEGAAYPFTVRLVNTLLDYNSTHGEQLLIPLLQTLQAQVGTVKQAEIDTLITQLETSNGTLRRIVHPPLPPTEAADFVGRENIFDAINHFVASVPNGYFTLEADPGAGKSAFLAEFVKRTGCIGHFNVRSLGVNTPAQFLESVCDQLIRRYQLPYTALPPEATQNGVFLTRLLGETAAALDPGEKLIIAVDALDEVNMAGQPEGTNILYLPPSPPENVYFVLTRREVDLPLTVFVPQTVYDLNAHQAETMMDVRTYLERAADRPTVQEWRKTNNLDTRAFVERLAELSAGNFMYLHYVLPEIKRGRYQQLSIDRLPSGLEGYYHDHWIRMGMMAKPLPRIKIRIVYILSEVRSPVSRSLIQQFAHEDHFPVDLLSVQEVLDEWDMFLLETPSEHGTRYSVYHNSFRDFLHRKDIVQAAGVTIADINTVIANDLWEDLFGE